MSIAAIQNKCDWCEKHSFTAIPDALGHDLTGAKEMAIKRVLSLGWVLVAAPDKVIAWLKELGVPNYEEFRVFSLCPSCSILDKPYIFRDVNGYDIDMRIERGELRSDLCVRLGKAIVGRSVSIVDPVDP